MQIARIRLIMDRLDNDHRLMAVTPAEAVLLRHMFGKETKHDTPVQDIEIVGDEKRSTVTERDRLLAKYGGAMNKDGSRVFDEVWPGEMPRFPETFKEAGFKVTEKEMAKAA